MFLKDLKLQLLSSLKPQETEFKLLKEHAIPLINLLNWHQLEKEFSYWEDLEIEKQKDISVSFQVKKDLTLLLMSEPKVVNSKEPEAEDDHPTLFKSQYSLFK